MKKLYTPTIGSLIENLQAIADASHLGMETPISVHSTSYIAIECYKLENKEGMLHTSVTIVGFD